MSLPILASNLPCPAIKFLTSSSLAPATSINKNKFQYKDVLKLFKEISGYENFKSLDERFLESTRPTVISKEKK